MHRNTHVVLGRVFCVVALLTSSTGAQPLSGCGLGETRLYIQVHGTDKLTACTDYFDNVDPYAIVSVGQDRLAVSKVTRTVDNEASPSWNQVLEFGCVESNTKLTFRVRDQDYFGDEACLGPLRLMGPWPPSGRRQVLCESPAMDPVVAGTPGTGCISFTLYYGLGLPSTIVSGDGTRTSTANTTSSLRPSTTPSLPSTLPSRPDTPSSPLPSVVTPQANVSTSPAENSDPHVPPPPRAPSLPPSSQSSPSPSSTSPRPPLVPSAPGMDHPSVAVRAPAPMGPEASKNTRHRSPKAALLAGGIISLVALVGIAAAVAVTRRRRRRAAVHNQGLEVDGTESGVRGAGGSSALGSAEVL